MMRPDIFGTGHALRRGARTVRREKGVAIVTALLLTTMAVTIVTSLFWQQQVQVRAIENQQFQSQKQWILRAALDWARLILSEDANNSSLDHFDEPWAAPLATTRLAEYFEGHRIEDGEGAPVLSEKIVDAQSRYNLANLAPNGAIDRSEVLVFQRLLASLQLNPNLSQAIAVAMVSREAAPIDQSDTVARNGSPAAGGSLRIEQLDDLLSVPGLSRDALNRLKEEIVILPHPTPINVNTASARLLAAKLQTIKRKEVDALVDSRNKAHFRENDVRLPTEITANTGSFSLMSNFFLIDGTVRLNRASLTVQALMERNPMIGSRVIWIKEN